MIIFCGIDTTRRVVKFLAEDWDQAEKLAKENNLTELSKWVCEVPLFNEEEFTTTSQNWLKL